MPLAPYQRTFIDLVIQHQALSFGSFTLKSGRISPYFFNLGKLQDGTAMQILGTCMAEAIETSACPFDSLCGPAYKGIPLVIATSIAFATKGRAVPYHFNRKEMKAHGEKSLWVGAPITGRVLLLDDVITAGTAIREIVPLLQAAGGTLAGIYLTLDRQERIATDSPSAVASIAAEYGIPVHSMITLQDIIDYVGQTPAYQAYLPAIEAYRAQYGVMSSTQR